MTIAKRIEVKTASGIRAAFLSPKSDGLKSVYLDSRSNGESTLEFMLPANSSKINHLTPECTIWAGDKVYNLLKDDAVDIVRDEKNARWAKFMAVERWNELDTQYPEPYISNDPTTPVPADLAVIIVAGGSNLSGGLYTVGSAGHALYAVLNGSGWTVGTVDVTGTHDLETEKVSRLVLVKEIQNIWGGYIVWNSVDKTVSLRNPNTWQNYTGFQIRYKKNLKNITRTQSNRLITKLYAFGKDDMDIASVNGGIKFVVNNSYTAKTYVGIYRNPDITNATELKNLAIDELALVCRPKYLYRGKIVDLRTLPEYSHEDFAVGDMADIIDPDVAPDSPRPRIIRHKYNLFQPWDCEFELGDPEERLVEKLKASFGTAGYIDNTLTSRGQLSGYKLEDGSVADVKVLNLDAAKITTGFLSANRIQAGSISADKITTGQLVVGTNVQIGTAQTAGQVTTIIGNTITTGYITALGLSVGTHIAMGPNATISWDKVTNQPYIPVLPSYITSTKITSTTIESPSITGGTITGGTVTGSTVQTAASGIRMAMTGDGIISYSGAVKEGVVIEKGLYGYSALQFYQNGNVMGELMYNNAGILSLSSPNANLYIWNAVAQGSWNFSSATVSGLSAYATASHAHSEYVKPFWGVSNYCYLDFNGTTAIVVRNSSGTVVGTINLT